LLDGAASDVDFKIAALKARFSVDNVEERVAYFNALTEMLARLDNAVERDVYAGKEAAALSVSKQALLDEIAKKRKSVVRAQAKQEFRAAQNALTHLDKHSPDAGKMPRAARAEEGLIALLLLNPGYLPLIEGKFTEDQLATELNSRLFRMIAGRIRQNKSIDFSLLSGEMTPQELGRLVEISAKEAVRANTQQEFLRCADIIVTEKEKTANQHAADMNQEDWAAMMRDLAAKKKGVNQ